MSGDPTKAALWDNADVYVDLTKTATEPTDVTTALAATWKLVGLLDGEKGFAEARDQDSAEFYAWGGDLVRSKRSKHKRTVKFTALEDNDVVFSIREPGSTRTTAAGVTTSTVKSPVRQECAILFQVTDGTTTKRRWSMRAEIVEVGEVVESETGLTAYEFTVVLYPISGVIYKEISGPAA